MDRALPNIVLIVMDATRADHLGCYGYARETSPHIDRFASEGTLYENAFAPGIWTLPAMASMFTGLYPIEHGVNQARAALRRDAITLVQVLKDLGYQTAAFVAAPWTSISSKLQFDTYRLVNRLFGTTDPQWWHIGLEKVYWKLSGSKDKGAQRVNAQVRSWLKRGENAQKPFFLYVHYMEPHGPYWPPKSHRECFVSSQIPPRQLRALANIELAYLADHFRPSRAQLGAINDLYDANVRYLDDQIGELIGILSQEVILDDTLIILTADHGENLGEHNLLGHQYCLYDTLLRVPLIIRYPDSFPINARMTTMVQTLDIMATVADVLGARVPWQPAASRWCSLVPESLAEGECTSRAYAQYSHPLVERFQRWYPDFDHSRYERRFWGIRTQEHKLIRDDQGSIELYNYRDDPGETTDLATQERELTSALSDELDSWLEGISSSGVTRQEDELDPVTADRLRGLGYL